MAARLVARDTWVALRVATEGHPYRCHQVRDPLLKTDNGNEERLFLKLKPRHFHLDVRAGVGVAHAV